MRDSGKRSFGSSGAPRANSDRYNHSRTHRISPAPERRREVARRRSRSRSRSPISRNPRRFSPDRLTQKPIDPHHKSNRDSNYRGRDTGPGGNAGSRSRPRESDRNNRNREDGRRRDPFKEKDREFDRVVKKAREEKSPGYWNKKVLEAEEKNPNRWGHSGFKELYRDDLGPRSRGDLRKKSRSRSPRKMETVRKSRSISPRRRRDGSREGSRGKGNDQRERKSPLTSSKLGSKVVVGSKVTDGVRRPAVLNKNPGHNDGSSSLNKSALNSRTKVDSRKEKLDKNRTESPQRSRSRSPLKDRKSGVAKSTALPKPRSQSSSSSDEDILELHPRRRKASGSFSPSINSSSSEDEGSSSDFSAGKAPAKTNSGSSSESSDSSEEENNAKSAVKNDSSGSRLDMSDSSVGSSPGQQKTTGILSVKKPRASAGKSKHRNSQTKKANGSGESESESGSSSESEDEPRMTLSERFAKLTQMSTDKREFAKLELSVGDIDTKLKVVKDLRNADTKIYLNGAARTTPNENARVRPKSPEYFDGEVKYNEDDRRKHFERMTRDEPENRPNDWNDVHVRYHYYKNRGYFDERPLSLEEYIKWEKWYYAYREWLANESLYQDQRNVAERAPYRGRNSEREGGRNWRDNTRPGEIQRTVHNRLYGQPPAGPGHGSPHHSQRLEPLLINRIVDHGRRQVQQQFDNRRHMVPRRPDSMIPTNSTISHPGQMNFGPQYRPGMRGTGRLAGRIGVRR